MSEYTMPEPTPETKAARNAMMDSFEAQLRDKYREAEKIAEEKVRRIIREELQRFGLIQDSREQQCVKPSPEKCECGHTRAMHFDEDGDHNGACLELGPMPHSPGCPCDMFRRAPARAQEGRGT